MNKYDAMQAFKLVCEQKSFAGAARKLQVSPTMISRYIRQLEEQYGCLLFNRNTRKVNLTEAGEYYQSKIKPLLKQLNEVELEIAQYNNIPQGKLSISASIEFGSNYLAPLVELYRAKYPKVMLNINLSNTPIDLLDGQTDLVFRVAPKLIDSNYFAQNICTTRLACWASNDYLKRHGMPSSYEELETHQLLFFSHSVRKEQWIFSDNGKIQSVKLPWSWRSDNGKLLNEAAAAGQGIIQAPSYSVANYVESGRLVEILDSTSIDPLIISAIYPHRYNLSSRIKTFVELAKDYFFKNPIG